MLNPASAHTDFHTGPPGLAYTEAAFRHFLAVDRSRARLSRRFIYLVLVAIRDGVGHRARLTDTTAAALFRGLGSSVREADFVGWYHERYVTAAVLFQGGKTTRDAATIADRVRTALTRQLPAPQLDRLRVRVVRLGGSNEARDSRA